LRVTSLPITNGDDNPESADHTNFGQANGPTITRTFTIKNTGNGNLTIGTGAITFIGPDAALFSVSNVSLPAVVTGPNGMMTFDVVYTPVAIGVHTATVSIANNDIANNPYTFDIKAELVCTTPVFVACPNNQTANTTSGQCTAVVSYTATVSGLPTPTITYTFTGATTASGSGTGSGSTFNKGVTNVVITASNSCASNVICSFTVTVTDNEPPAITCPDPVSINTDSGLCTGTTTLTAPAVSDNCTNSFGNALNFSGGYVDVPDALSLNLINQWTLEAWVKLSSTGFQQSLIEKYTCSSNNGYILRVTPGSNLQAYAASGCGGGIVTGTTSLTVNTWYHVAATYNLSTQTLRIYVNGVLEGTLNGVTTPLTPTGVSLKIGARGDDGTGRLQGTMDEVRLWNIERTLSEISSSMNTELSAQAGLVALYHFNQGIAGENNTGITSVSDVSGSNNHGSFVSFALTGANSNFVSGLTFGAPTVLSNAPLTYPLGNTTVVWTATDAAGKTATCGQTVTVVDNQPPILTCPINQTMNAPAGTCAANYTIADPIADNCTATWGYTLTVATSGSSTGIADGTDSGVLSFNVGETTVTLSGTDGTNNATTCSFMVKIVDNQPPTDACPTNITQSATSGQCSKAVVFTLPTPNDNCSATSIANYSSGSTFNVGTTVVQVVATDASGNTATCSFTITVTDNEPPSITCNSAVTISNTTGFCYGNTPLVLPAVTDNCVTIGNALAFDGIDDVVNLNTPLLSTSNASQPYTIEFWMKAPNNASSAGVITQYTTSTSFPNRFGIRLDGDDHITYWKGGNFLLTSTHTFTNNTWHHIAFVKQGSGANQLKLYIDGVLDGTGTDATAFENFNTIIGRFPGSPSIYNGILDEVRIWNVARTQSQIIASINLELNAQSGLIAAYHFNEGTANVDNAGLTTAIDASGNGVNGTLQNFSLSGTLSNWVNGYTFGTTITNDALLNYPIGNTTVMWTATDESGNIATCTQLVTVTDNQNPTITCPANVTQTVTSGACSMSITTSNPTTGDNCSVTKLTWTTTGATILSSPSTGINNVGTNTFNIGVTSVTYTVYDAANNSATCSFNVTVNAPEINVQKGISSFVTIPDGNTAISTSDYTDFGSVIIGSSFTRTYRIQNTGTALLAITGTSVTGTNASEFVVTTAPASTVAVAGTTTFIVTFTPTALGTRSAVIHIANNDCSEADYDFAVQGTGTCSNTCLNGATQNNDCSCNCLTGYTGVNCQIATYIFYGYTNTDWSTASNWNTGVVPTTALLTNGDAVIVAANCVMPAVNIAFPSGTIFTVNSGVSLSADLNAYITINSGAVFTINGSLSQGRVTNTGSWIFMAVMQHFI
jgi:hypothetical protein